MSDEIKEMLNKCVGAVEANTFESMCLWQGHNGTWVSATSGRLTTVGHIDDMPVCISLLVNIVNGSPILFYYPTSIMVDYRLIDAWLNMNMPDTAKDEDGRVLKTDAMNFHIVTPPIELENDAA